MTVYINEKHLRLDQYYGNTTLSLVLRKQFVPDEGITLIDKDGNEEKIGQFKYYYKLTTDRTKKGSKETERTVVHEIELQKINSQDALEWGSKIGVFSNSQVLYGMDFSTEVQYFAQRKLILNRSFAK